MVGKGGLPPLVECHYVRSEGQTTLPNHETFILERSTNYTKQREKA